jgi:hypothetical protein
VSAKPERSFSAGLCWCLGLGLALALGAAWLIRPLQRGAGEKARAVSEKTVALARARNAMQHVRELEPAAAEARGRLNALMENFGADPIATLTPVLKEHFRRAGFDANLEELKTAEEIKALPGYVRRRLRMQMAFPDEGDRVRVLLEAAAALEQRSPLIRVERFELQPLPAGPQERQATIELSILLAK